jgi:hypothetical protein
MGRSIPVKTEKPSLLVGTPVIRPWNLPLILPEVEKAREFFDLHWWITLDALYEPRPVTDWEPEEDWITLDSRIVPYGPRRAGERLQNAMLDRLGDDEWWWGLADDNLPTPGFFSALRREADAGAEAVVFPCAHSSGLLKAEPGNMKESAVDGAQIAYMGKVIGKQRFEDDVGWCLDGYFVRKVYERQPERFRFLKEPVLHYNRLR